MLAIVFSLSSTFRDMIVHCILLLFTDLAVRTAEIIVRLAATGTGTDLLERLAAATHLGITGEAITNILGLLGLLGCGSGGRGHLLIDTGRNGLIIYKAGAATVADAGRFTFSRHWLAFNVRLQMHHYFLRAAV